LRIKLIPDPTGDNMALTVMELNRDAGPVSQERGELLEVSVVMPCLNEARTVGRCVDKALQGLAGCGAEGEVVVADNGSSDGSAVLARERGARVVAVAARGYGSALQGGIAAARGRFVVMGDADDSYDFTLLAPFIERLRAGDELVMGNRFKGGIRPGAMPWLHRYLGNPVLTGILNLLFRTPAGDAHCGLRGFDKEAYVRLGLVAPGMEFASEMVVRAALCGLRIGEVPVVLYPDGRDRPPHLRSFRDGFRHLRLMLSMAATSRFGAGRVLVRAPAAPGGIRNP
jgi:glycosyltransferase involved in cell wall biosynthesis